MSTDVFTDQGFWSLVRTRTWVTTDEGWTTYTHIYVEGHMEHHEDIHSVPRHQEESLQYSTKNTCRTAWEDSIITQHEYNWRRNDQTQWSLERTYATCIDGYIYMDDRGSHRRLGLTIGWYDRVGTHAGHTNSYIYINTWYTCGGY
jgi:hypothetical protein